MRIIALVLFLSILSVSAQMRWAESQTTLNGGTNVVAANTTNALAIRLDVPQAKSVVLWTNFRLHGAGTSPVEFILAPGSESSYETNLVNVHRWNVTPNGTTGVAGITNIALGAVPHLWLLSCGHNNGQVLTNLSFSYGFKR